MSAQAPDTQSARGLPAPALDACDLQQLFPDLDPAAAARATLLATIAIEAALWPNPIPDPIPPPVQAVLLTVAARLAGSSGLGSTQVVSESIGAYSYRLAGPPSIDTALGLSEAEAKALEPWAAKAGVYELHVGPAYYPWPVGWWQADYDNLVAFWDASTFPGGSDPDALSGVKP
jgi:hypothetical protein